jgi:hypothetical protein
MAKKLSLFSGERIDLVDMIHGANTYTEDSQAQTHERLLLDRRSRVIDGFRIVVEDQTLNPGMVTVINGNALDREGKLLNNEELANDSRSITLLGTSQTFYVELEFIETESDSDARFFWDPSVPNTSPIPNGQEFSRPVATRITPDWRIVSPVSTTGFEQTSNANSLRVPVGVFITNGSNQINSGSTPGLTLVRAASVMEEATLIGATKVRVFDARPFPGTLPFNATVDVFGTSPEATTVSAIDRDNGILTLTGPLAVAHAAGAVVRVTSGLAAIMREKTDPSDAAAHPDPAQRFWQANEVRGSALSVSKEITGTRDDLNLRSMKDEVDFLAAQLREMKFGSMNPATTSAAPPIAFPARPRYFDPAGSILGARSNTVSIGNGTTTFGDFNGTNAATVFVAAIAALPASGGTIFVKNGTYLFPSTVNITKSVRWVGESRDNVILRNTNAVGSATTVLGAQYFENLTIDRDVAAAHQFIQQNSFSPVYMNRVIFTGLLERTVSSSPFTIIAEDCQFTNSTGSLFTAGLTSSTFNRCGFDMTGHLCLGEMENVWIDGCSGAAQTLFQTGPSPVGISGVHIINNDMTFSSAIISLSTSGTATVYDLFVENNKFTVTVADFFGAIFLSAEAEHTSINITNNRFVVIGGASDEAYVIALLEGSGGYAIHQAVISGNLFLGSTNNNRLQAIVMSSENVREVIISSNVFEHISTGVQFGLTGYTAIQDSSVVISDCIYRYNGSFNSYGVRVNAGSFLGKITIEGLTYSATGATGASEQVAIELGTTMGSSAVHNISGCVIGPISGNSTGAKIGIAHRATSAATAATINISGCTIFNLSCDTLADLKGIFINNTFTQVNSMTISITNNVIKNFSGSTSTGAVIGIDVRDVQTLNDVIISGNTVLDIGAKATGASAVSRGIYVQDGSNVNITGNTVRRVYNVGWASVTGAGQSACIYLNQPLTTDTYNIAITNNEVDQATHSTPAETGLSTIRVITDSITNNVVVSTNRVWSSTTNSEGIFIGGNSTPRYRNLSVTGNTVRHSYTGATSSNAGIYVAPANGSYGIAITGNTVLDPTDPAANSGVKKGIVVNGLSAGVQGVDIVGNVLTGPKTGALVTNVQRVGIAVDSVAETAVTGNVVNWNEPAVLVGTGIGFGRNTSSGTFAGHACSGNKVRADGGANGIFINTTNMTSGYVTGNALGIAGTAGTINPVSAAATSWDYGAATGTGTFNGVNKLS